MLYVVFMIISINQRLVFHAPLLSVDGYLKFRSCAESNIVLFVNSVAYKFHFKPHSGLTFTVGSGLVRNVNFFVRTTASGPVTHGRSDIHGWMRHFKMPDFSTSHQLHQYG